MASASPLVNSALCALCADTWPIPARLQNRLFLALKRSQASRAVLLKNHLALVAYADLDAFFIHIATPEFMMGLCDDLVATRHLTRHEASVVQDAILKSVAKDGKWLTFHEYEEKHHVG
jgi:hypothetical protein